MDGQDSEKDGTIDLHPPFQIPVACPFRQEYLQLACKAIPREMITGEIRILGSMYPRCKIRYGRTIYKGAHGAILHAIRYPDGTECCVKRPHHRSFSLCCEALLQWRAEQVLRKAGCAGAVPRVIDIYEFAGETRFSMEYIQGQSSVEAILKSTAPDFTFTHILAQTALLLGTLQRELRLDHRDLKADNLWIRQNPVHYRVQWGDTTWSLTSPFQVVLLDFGFACLGEKPPGNRTLVNLHDGVLPELDPCPKSARDLFQLLVSLWSIPAVRASQPAAFQRQIASLFLGKKDYTPLLLQTDRSQWSYLSVSDPHFRHPPLEPEALLLKLMRDWAPRISLEIGN